MRVSKEQKDDILIIVAIPIANLRSGEFGKESYHDYKAFSGAVEEYIEAETFFHYRVKKRLITKAEIENLIAEVHPQNIPLKLLDEDYVKGIGDLT